MDTERCDVVVCGAGPAGLAAAAVIEEAGLRVHRLDENPLPRGQLLRPCRKPTRGGLDPARRRGLRLLASGTTRAIPAAPPHQVIGVFPDREILAVDAGNRLIRLKPQAICGFTAAGCAGAGG
jgi:2-polyprenyl-6-methoxyphenol hydroxylase-like FAD-dependent oxidoreductase